jgi:hypothetical protein
MQIHNQVIYVNEASNVVDLDSLYIFLKIAMEYHPFITSFSLITCILIGVFTYYYSKQYCIKRLVLYEDVN